MQTGGDQINTKSMQLTNKTQNDPDFGNVSSDLNLVNATSDEVDIGTIKKLNKYQKDISETKEYSSHYIKNKNMEYKTDPAIISDESFKIVIKEPSKNSLRDTEKEINFKETTLFKSQVDVPRTAAVALQNCEGSDINLKKIITVFF